MSRPVVWSPLAGSQALALSCPCDLILYDGSRGPGKTDAQLMSFRARVGRGYGSFWRGIIIDRDYKSLDDIVAKSIRWYSSFNDGARFLRSRSDYKWVWPTGEELLFRAISHPRDYWSYHGQEYPFIGFNELTKFPSPEIFDLISSCNRTGSPTQIPLVIFATTNPFGPGHNWVKKRFIDAAPAGVVRKITTDVFNPRSKKVEPITRTAVRIFGSYKENKYLPPEYIAQLESIDDENRKRAWLHGDWNVISGGALDDVWHDGLIIEPFNIPANWRVDRSMDWGSSHPFSIGWWAESNGEAATLPSGKEWAPPSGTLIRIAEWYGCAKDKNNVGLKLSAKDIARGIKAREAAMQKSGLVAGLIHGGAADTQISAVNDVGTDTIEKAMRDEGVSWSKAAKFAGSRKQGLQLIRDRMIASRSGEGAGIYFFRSCQNAIELLPILPRSQTDPDDVDTEAEDHLYDDVRYRVLFKKSFGGVISGGFYG